MSCPDDFDFLLGVPTPVEMWQQHARLLEEECHELRDEMRKLKGDRRKLVQMHSQAQQELADVRKRAEELQTRVNLLYVELVQQKNSHSYPYSYGDYSKMAER